MGFNVFGANVGGALNRATYSVGGKAKEYGKLAQSVGRGFNLLGYALHGEFKKSTDGLANRAGVDEQEQDRLTGGTDTDLNGEAEVTATGNEQIVAPVNFSDPNSSAGGTIDITG
ncbi:MAG: hypothetical protein KKB81_01720 [Candidatus Margulisbacteria bacterium]|nr:hypothetical protein [Candidatus Margulisiibacteriota bacterium]MBU1021634.1 hypothetical protein [Candidatus Margulisiibacteriota bacterium]MBU1728784.1 hypothetical protein [Candidatus Margulisiibacteriota bacterium]MBU1955750.1 hypothetical protein [Candidatus Margulisiibacteriota bacterium]